MKPEETHIFEWGRVFVGDVPPAFLFEVLLRMAAGYIILIVSMRVLGKRMAAQLTRNELASVTSLAAGVGLPIVAPDRGMLPSFMIAFIVVIVTRLISTLSARSQRVEALTQGSISILVDNGQMIPHAMEKTGVSRERVLGQLRSKQIRQLGEVKNLFFEANGNFTIVRAIEPTAGLCVLPDDDITFVSELKCTSREVCHVCGATRTGTDARCRNCGKKHWVHAIE